jgi:hypothetical protein
VLGQRGSLRIKLRVWGPQRGFGLLGGTRQEGGKVPDFSARVLANR